MTSLTQHYAPQPSALKVQTQKQSQHQARSLYHELSDITSQQCVQLESPELLLFREDQRDLPKYASE